MNGDSYEIQGGSTIINWSSLSGPAAKLTVTSTALNQVANACGAITITLQDAAGTTVTAGQDYTINLTSTSANGVFYPSAGCATSSIASATLSSGASTITVYYKDANSGAPLTTMSEVPSSGLTDATQTQTINSAGGAPTKLVISGPATVTSNFCSAVFDVIVQDASSIETNATTATTVTFSGGGRATFYSDSGCTTPVASRVISNGTSRTSFYYKFNPSGTFRICKYRKSSTGIATPTMGGNPLKICAETDEF